MPRSCDIAKMGNLGTIAGLDNVDLIGKFQGWLAELLAPQK